MEPNKSQLDTIELYLRKLVSESKAKEVVARFAKKDEEVADKAIKLFETRSMVRLQDIERVFD